MVDPRTGHVHVVNDTCAPLPDAEVTLLIDGRPRRWRGSIDVDAVTFVGTADLDDAVDVEAIVEHHEIGRVANRYPLVILEAGRPR
jgi:hypothetical protein